MIELRAEADGVGEQGEFRTLDFTPARFIVTDLYGDVLMDASRGEPTGSGA